MILTKQDKEMFDNMKETAQGKWLADYCERLQAFMCDCRNWKSQTSQEAMIIAAEKINNHLVANIKNINKKSGLPDFK